MGIDEAGRGPLAGGVVVASCVLDINYQNPQINDSKKLSSKKIELIALQIFKEAVYYRILYVPVVVIDELNIYQATKLGMEILAREKNYIKLIDAMKLDATINHHSIIKGDTKSISIAAASILAKYYRDLVMKNLDKLFPQYQFARHKAYPTKLHYQLIKEHGISLLHRKSFKLIKE